MGAEAAEVESVFGDHSSLPSVGSGCFLVDSFNEDFSEELYPDLGNQSWEKSSMSP